LVLDLCAAPGGKAAQLAERFSAPARVVALDAQFHRISRIRDTQRRLGLENLQLAAADGTRPPLRPANFDAVLVDAPCSGTGVLARRHEARWRRKPHDLVELPQLQRELLNSAVELCAYGGIIVYATCSLEQEENEAVVDAVLAEREDLMELGVPAGVPKELVREGRLRVWPHLHDCDGAFAAVLKRKEIRS
jgi:16S rRNA (cytosine967-C5)-methyltransferase